MRTRTTLSAAFTAAALALATPLAAQDETMVEPAEIVAADVTESQVTSFVDALIAIEEVRAEYTPKLQAAEDETAREALAAEANREALAAVENVEGLNAAEYMGIGKAASEDEELSARIAAAFEEARGTQAE